MKNKSNIVKFFLLLAPAMLFLGSCSKERGGRVPGNGEKEVDMTFLTPGASRAAIASEDALKDITLLVFDGSSTSSTFLYSRYAWRTSAGENKFKTTLQIKDDVTIYFAANVQGLIKDLVDGGDLAEGTTTWAEARELLTLDTPTGFDLANKGLPMWGHKYDVDIADAPNNSLGRVNLLRAVASADVSIVATNFTLEKGHLVYAANKGYLAYDPTLLSGVQVTGPQSPADMTTTVDWSKTVAAGATDICNYFYMYDNATSLTPSGANRPTKIILEGVWNDAAGSGATTFYPLSLRNYNSATQEYDKKQATRNNKYLIAVTGVNGDGWTTLDEAKNADDVNMEYEVVEWNENDDEDIFIDGSKYLSIKNKAVTLQYFKSTADEPNVKEIVFTTNYTLSDIKMTFTSGGTPVANTVSNDRFKAEALSVDPDGSAGTGDEYTCFRFTALEDYDETATDNPSTLYVTVGRVSFNIIVTQAARENGDWDDGGNEGIDL